MKKIINITWGFGYGGIEKSFLNYEEAGKDILGEKFLSYVIGWDPKNRGILSIYKNDVKVVLANGKNLYSLARKTAEIIRREKVDVAILHGYKGPLIFWLAKKIWGVATKNVYCIYHGDYVNNNIRMWFWGKFVNYFSAYYYKRWAKGIVSVSEFSKKKLIERGIKEEKIEVIYNTVLEEFLEKFNQNGKGKISGEEEALFREIKKMVSGKITIGLVSRLVRKKGVEEFIECANMVNRKRNDVLFLIAGDGPLKEKIFKKNPKGVILLGWVKNIIKLLKLIDIIVFPSHYENHSISLLESMYIGKPIIATKVGGNIETIVDGESGILFSPGNVKEMYEGVENLISSNLRRKELVQKTRERYIGCFSSFIFKGRFKNWLGKEIPL